MERQAAEIQQACKNPSSLIDYLARLVARKHRPGVISDTWSYRNQLIVLLHGHSEARGFMDWMKVGRTVAVFGLEQTEPMQDRREERKHSPGDDESSNEIVSVFHGYGQPWYGSSA